jgi:hypothetical protein
MVGGEEIGVEVPLGVVGQGSDLLGGGKYSLKYTQVNGV